MIVVFSFVQLSQNLIHPYYFIKCKKLTQTAHTSK